MSTLYNHYGGAELYFSYVPADTKSVTIRTDALGLAHEEAASDTWWVGTENSRAISLTIFTEETDTTLVTCQSKINSVVKDQSTHSMRSPNVNKLHVKVIMAVKSISVYCNDEWIYTHVFRDVMWPEAPKLYLSRSSSFLIENIKRVELSDRREAVYVDYEATADSAIQSVIQQRPVQIFPEPGRANAYTYSAVRDLVNLHNVNSYEVVIRDNQNLSSDGLVYYLDVGVSISKETAKNVGLITKLYRLSELNNGAIEAASRIQKLALQQREMVSITMRLDPRIEIGDNLLLDVNLTGTGTHLTDSVIVENISIAVQNASYQMSISARRKL